MAWCSEQGPDRQRQRQIKGLFGGVLRLAKPIWSECIAVQVVVLGEWQAGALGLGLPCSEKQ